MDDVVEEFKAYSDKLLKLQDKEGLDEKGKRQLKHLIALLRPPAALGYVKAPDITQVSKACKPFSDNSIQELIVTLQKYCKSILEHRRKLIEPTLSAMQCSKKKPENEQSFPKDLCILLKKSTLALTSYCQNSSLKMIVSMLRESGIFPKGQFNFELELYQVKQEKEFFKEMFIQNPAAQQSIRGGDFLVLETEELKKHYAELARYGKNPKLPSSLRLTRSEPIVGSSPSHEPLTSEQKESQRLKELEFFDLICATKRPERIRHPAGDYGLELPQYLLVLRQRSEPVEVELLEQKLEGCSLSSKGKDKKKKHS